MTEPVVVDFAALQTFVEHMTAVADDIAELSTARSTAMHPLSSIVERLDAPNAVSTELQRICTALRDWAHHVRRSQLRFAAAEHRHAEGLGHR